MHIHLRLWFLLDRSVDIYLVETRILMESTMPLTLDHILEYENAQSGECMVGVPAVSSTIGWYIV